MMEAHDPLLNARAPFGYGGLFYGACSALVTDIKDPDGQGRVRIRLPWSPDPGDASYQAWARIATMMAGSERGTWFIPDVDDEVLVLFENGNPRRPYVIGSLWNGRDKPPESMDSAAENNLKTIKSRNGVTVTLDDSNGQERLLLETPAGQKIALKDGPGNINVEDSNGNSVKLEPAGITVNSSAKVTINASLIEMSAGTVTVNAGMSRFSGVVHADTVISSSVISASYTPGAGNIW